MNKSKGYENVSATILTSEQLQSIYSECKLSTSRSGGPGGQHVNKVETKVTLKWTVGKCSVLSDRQIRKIRKELKNQITTSDTLVLYEQSARDQKSNKERIFKKLRKLLLSSLKEKKKRKATKPSKSSIAKNKASKKKRSEIKSLRKSPRLK